MYDLVVIGDWLTFAVRWLHVITAIAWIGSSFYFIALDLGLRRAEGLPAGAHGEEWQVHGGGFYHIQKYLVAPEALPEHLTWFKWESYATWLSGAALLILVYWVGAELFLIDRSKADLSVFTAILISGASLILGWLVYDLLCKSPLAARPTLLMVVLFALIVAMSWGFAQIFTGRAALLHVGAVTATLMTGNVFLAIIPNQKIVVADLKAGRAPDAKYGEIAKLRSTHNNYLTLPVIFLMLSNHYPLAFATEYNWLIASLVFLMGVTIRHYFNMRHAGTGNPTWTWLATAVVFIVIMWLSTAPIYRDAEGEAAAPLTARQQALVGADGFEAVHEIVTRRCAMCHAAAPSWADLRWPPKGVALQTEAEIARRAAQIFLQSAVSRAMPPGNVTNMTRRERRTIAEWWRANAGAAGWSALLARGG